ncbi:VOC family protein [Aquihabitans sp. G128]|nr:VOC family protein [Aquihabitans sp. G128]QXC61968.1 VOC family protein [Aquihabitans sp. G128]
MTPDELADLAHLRRARDLMDREYARPLDVPAMARAALMSPAHFSRKFRAAYGETPYSYLMTRRIERAKALLRQGTSVTGACVAVGATSLGSFSALHRDRGGDALGVPGAGPRRARGGAVVRQQGRHAAASDPRLLVARCSRHPAPPSRIGEAAGRGCPYGRAMATTTVSQMFISVHDPEEALAFYRDALGFEVRMDVSSDGFRWVTVGAPGQDVDIVLSQPHGGRSQAEGDALLALVTQGSLQAAIFKSDDLDATFEQVRSSGAEVLQEPTSQPWGARDCAFRDPSGNLVRIAQA